MSLTGCGGITLAGFCGGTTLTGFDGLLDVADNVARMCGGCGTVMRSSDSLS